MNNTNSIVLTGWMADFDRSAFYKGQIRINGKRIEEIVRLSDEMRLEEEIEMGDRLILPGLIDAHIHLESSMLTPARFAEMAVRFGTVATVSDPHEIANVCGIDGIKFMIRQAKRVPLKIHYTIPSCVPATDFETAGARLTGKEIGELIEMDDFVALGEMMNYPGVINQVPEVMEKLALAQKAKLPIDGHIPGVTGNDLKRYVQSGISTDHECFTIEEAKEKLSLGMKILIREGSAARNFEALWPLLNSHPESVMLCSDDLHPDDLMVHHMDELIRRGLKKGVSIFNLLRAASRNPIEHYSLPVGKICVGDPADFIVVTHLQNFHVQETWIDGIRHFSQGKVLFSIVPNERINRFVPNPVHEEDLAIRGESGKYHVIGALDGELITENRVVEMHSVDGEIKQDFAQDVLKVVVVNRYGKAKPAVGLITGFGLSVGAMASSIAHDSHQIIALGTNDQDLCEAINQVIQAEGGIVYTHNKQTELLPLPVAGLMSDLPAGEVGEKYSQLSKRVKQVGCKLKAPFMSLSFMALLVIPSLKMSDLGLFDSDHFSFILLKLD